MYTFTVFGVFHVIDFSCATFVRHALHPSDEETGSLREIVTYLLLMKSAIGERRGCGSFCWEKWCRAGQGWPLTGGDSRTETWSRPQARIRGEGGSGKGGAFLSLLPSRDQRAASGSARRVGNIRSSSVHVARELAHLETRPETSALRIPSICLPWCRRPWNPEMTDLLFGFFLRTIVITGKRRPICLPREWMTALNLAGWVNILKCWCQPSTDSVFLKETIIFRNRRMCEFIRFQSLHSAVVCNPRLYLAIKYTSKPSFSSPTISELYGSLPCPQLQFDNPTLVWEETNSIRLLCPKQLIHLTWLSGSFPGRAWPGWDQGQPRLSPGLRALGGGRRPSGEHQRFR